MSEDSGKRTKISRRDFLKLSGIAGGILAIESMPKPVKKALSSPEEKDKKKRVKVDTDLATYYPFYERHDIPISVKEIKDVEKIDALFYESSRPALDFQQKFTPYTLITFADSGHKQKSAVELYKYFSDNNIALAWEGVDIPEKYKNSVNYILPSVTFTSGVVFLKQLSKIFNEYDGKASPKKINKEIKKTLPLAGVWAWAVSTPIVGNSLLQSEDVPAAERTHQVKTLRRSLQRANAILEHLHPENLIIFFRNIIMARKLQTLAKHKIKESKSRPNIGYVVGAGHAGIEDLLVLGEEFTLLLLSIYPDKLLKNIVDHNGGIDAFSKTVITPIMVDWSNNIYATATTTIIDNELKLYLENRLPTK